MSNLREGFGRLMSQERASIVLTLLFGAMGWTATRTIEQITAVPFIEYKIKDESAGGARQLQVRLRNVTYTKEFCIKLIVGASPKGNFKFDVENYDVKLSSTQVPDVRPSPGARQMAFDIDKFGPKSDISLIMLAQGDAPVRLFSRECAPEPSGAAATSTSGGGGGDGRDKWGTTTKVRPLLIERSLRTWLVEWELQVLWALILLWAALVLPFSVTKPKSQIRLTLRRPVTLAKRKEN